MLDDLKMIHERDAQDALGIAEKQWQQLEYTFNVDANASIASTRFENIVFAGMGGSALAALICTSWPGFEIPFEICRNYEIPNYTGSATLFFASSYSGNTEETVAALESAAQKGAKIIVIASGGKLSEIASEKGYPFYQLPGGLQPRHAVLYSLKALIVSLETYGIMADKSSELTSKVEFLKQATSTWRPDIPTANNPAKQLALELMGKSPVIYAGPKMWPAAYKWKISFNENAKNVAWCNQFSEFNHNEFMGWASHPIDKPYGIIELTSHLEHERIQKRFDISNRLLSGRWPQPHVINAEGDGLLEQLLWAIAMGDFVSLYLALLNGINPTPVELIEKLKVELNN